MTQRVLVTGVRGKTGTALAALLTGRGVEVVGGSSDPTTVDLAGVRPVAFSWDDPAGWPAALEGVDGVYVVRPDRLDAPELVAALLARTATTVRVVLLSEREAGYHQHDHWALRVEDAVRQTGNPWTVLRPSWFLQVLTDPRFYRDEIAAGSLSFPSDGARVAWIDARDIAAVAAVALVDGGQDGQVLELSGPGSLTLPELVGQVAEAVGHPVVHHDISVEDAAAGTEGFTRDLTLLTFHRVRDGAFAEVTGVVEAVTGQPARSASAFLGDAASSLRDVAAPGDVGRLTDAAAGARDDDDPAVDVARAVSAHRYVP